jgi:hypothetical protein
MRVEPKASNPNQTAKNEMGDFAQFTNFMRQLVSVPHSKIKAELDAEKKAKRSKTASHALASS